MKLSMRDIKQQHYLEMSIGQTWSHCAAKSPSRISTITLSRKSCYRREVMRTQNEEILPSAPFQALVPPLQARTAPHFTALLHTYN